MLSEAYTKKKGFFFCQLMIISFFVLLNKKENRMNMTQCQMYLRRVIDERLKRKCAMNKEIKKKTRIC